MKKTFWDLSEEEKAFKKLFNSEYHSEYHKAMLYSVLESYDSNIKQLYATIAKYHRLNDASGDDNTVTNVFNNINKHVSVVRHPRYSFPILHKHEDVELIYVYSGNCIHFIEDGMFNMPTGDLCILAPNTNHGISVTNDETIVINILINKELLDDGFINMFDHIPQLGYFFKTVLFEGKTAPYILFPTGMDRWLHESIYQLWIESDKTSCLYNECLTLFVRQIFIHLIRHYNMHAVVSEPDSYEHNESITALIGYITVNFKNITLEQTATFFGYNKAYLGQLIQKYTGKTFPAFVNDIAMRKAAQLLEETDESITNIAHDIGCYDSSHFNRRFMKVFHISPSEYKKKNNKLHEI